jgi:hypothetical protein
MRILLMAVTVLLVGSSVQAGVMWSWGARISTPQILSGSGSLILGRIDAPARPPDAPPPTRMHIPTGLLLQAEPGLGGGKVGVGFAKGLPPVAAGGVKAFYLRTWGHPLWADKNRDYVGVEADATLFMNLRVGVMRSVGEGRRDTALTAGIGVGF